jgi:hypothetical protein
VWFKDPANSYKGDWIKQCELSGACDTHEDKRNIYTAWGENLQEREHLEDTGAERRKLLKYTCRN